MKPTLGYPSRILAIRALRQEGKTETQIAALLGIKPNSVTSIEARARARCSYGKGGRQKVFLSGDCLIGLHDEAERRGISVHSLATQLLRVIAREDLVDAILDDQTDEVRQ